MKEVQVTAYAIPCTEKMDAITVYFQDYELGKGKVLLECYGDAWTAYFGAMGDRTIKQFFLECGSDYLVNKLGITPYLKKSNLGYLKNIINATQNALREVQS